jgi:hypothetical protein
MESHKNHVPNHQADKIFGHPILKETKVLWRNGFD